MSDYKPRFHLNLKTGRRGECEAVYSCPFGEENHYDTLEEADDAYHEYMSGSSSRVLKKKVLKDESLPQQFIFGEVHTEGVNFKRVYSTYENDRLEGTLDDFHNHKATTFSYDNEGARLSLNLNGAHETIEYVAFNARDLDEYGLLKNESLSWALESAMEKAKEKYPDVFDQNHPAHGKLKRLFSQIQNDDEPVLDGVALQRTGFGAPDIWEAPLDDRPGYREIYVRSRHGLATAYLVSDEGERTVLASTEVGYGEWDRLAQARFFAQVNDRFIAETA